MKVKQLIEKLSKLDPNALVVLQKDSEGNGYSPLYCVDGDAIYVPENNWSGEVYSTTLSAEDMELETEEWEKLLKRPRCVVLAPTN